MRKTILPLTLFALFLSSCCEDSADLFWNLLPDAPAVPCDSTLATPDIERFAAPGSLREIPLADGSKTLLASSEGVSWMDLYTGKVLRSIDAPVAGKAFANSQAVYRNGDLAVAASGSGLAVVDMRTYDLVWQRTLGDCAISLGAFGAGDRYFIVRKIMEPDGVGAEAVFMGSLREADRLDPLFTPAYSHADPSWAGYGRITAVAPFIGADGHTYVLSSYFETRQGTVKLDVFLALYDVTAGAWVYERRSPNAAGIVAGSQGIRQITVSGALAYMLYQGKMLVWNLADGAVAETIFPAGDTGFEDMQISGEYMVLAGGNSDVLVLDQRTHSQVARIYPVGSGNIRADFTLDRLFVCGAESITAYRLSTGEKLQTITSPCEQFVNGIVVWKDAYGSLHLAVGDYAGKLHHYLLQP